MATKLKNLKIRKVDFVDEGANPDAHIGLLKRKGGEANPEGESGGREPGNVLKKLLGFIGMAAGMDQEEIDSAVDEIRKGDSVSFGEKINEAKNRKIADEIWDTCYALEASLISILNDEDLDSASAETAMKGSLDEFYAAVQVSIKEWSNGRSAGIVRKSGAMPEAEVKAMESAVERLREAIGKARGGTDGQEDQEEDEENGNQKGDEEDMKIDKSKLTDAERAFLESIEKRCGADEGAEPGGGSQADAAGQAHQDPAVEKSAHGKSGEEPTGQEEPGDIYKGLHPAVKAELESLKKFREDAEDRELAEVAKRYAVIGKKVEDLVPLFKSLKSTGGTAYNDMIAVLDQAVDTVEKSGAFSEIGKSGHGGPADGGAWAEAEVKAAELMKSRTGLSKAQALDEVLLANPELAERCEKED